MGSFTDPQFSVLYHDETVSRDIVGTEVQNGSFKRMLIVSLTIQQGGISGQAYVILKTKDTSPANVNQTIVGDFSGAPINSIRYAQVVGYVLPNQYYSITKTTTANGVVALDTWLEIDMF